jgi:hypothetical protein
MSEKVPWKRNYSQRWRRATAAVAVKTESRKEPVVGITVNYC